MENEENAALVEELQEEKRRLGETNSQLRETLKSRTETMHSLSLVVGVGVLIACLGESYHWSRSDTVNLQFGWGIWAFCAPMVWGALTEKVSLKTKQKVNQLWREGWGFIGEWGVFVPCGVMACLVVYPCKGLWFLAKWPYRLLRRSLKG